MKEGNLKSLCLVIPCFNEAKRLQLQEFLHCIETTGTHFLFVDDGSSDETFKLIEAFAKENPANVRCFKNERNLGKGNAVRVGVLQTYAWKSFDYVGYWDADLSAPLEEIDTIMSPLHQSKYSFSFGSRLLRIGGNIKRNGFRHYISRISATFAAETLSLPVYDTQCGAKVFSRAIVEDLFKKPFISSWLFDVELFFRCKARWSKTEFFENTIEVPINHWTEVGDSRVKFNNVIKVPLELYKIKNYYKKTW